MDSVIEPSCSAGCRGTSGAIHLPWQAHPGRQTREALLSAFQDEYHRISPPHEERQQEHPRLFFGFFFFIGLTRQFFP